MTRATQGFKSFLTSVCHRSNYGVIKSRVGFRGILHEIDVVTIMAPAYERGPARKLRSEWALAGELVLAGRDFERIGPLKGTP